MSTQKWLQRAARHRAKKRREKYTVALAALCAMGSEEARALWGVPANPPAVQKSPHPLLDADHASEPVEICPVGMAVIYALVDPRDGTVRYVGKSTQPGDRLRSHISQPHRNRRLRSWIRTLSRKREQPELHAIDLVALADWPEAERKWIAFYRERGVIFNIEDGGPSKPRTSKGPPHAPVRKAGTEPTGSHAPRAVDSEHAQPAAGRDESLPEKARDDVQRFAVASHAPINLRGASAEARDWDSTTHAEPHSWNRDASDPPPSHREPTAGVTEGPHVRTAGVTSGSGLSPAEHGGDSVGADPST